MKFAVAVGIPLFAVLACGAPTGPAGADPVDTPQIVGSVRDTIWPALNAYNGAPTQNSPGSAQFRAVVDPGLRSDVQAYGALQTAAQALGQQAQFDQQTRITHSHDGMALARADVQSSDGNVATVNACYTYTDRQEVNIGNSQQSPAASQATMTLANVDGTWYLRAITDDHVVPGC